MLLLLLGDKSENFLSCLRDSVHLFSSFIIHDVAHESYLEDVLKILDPIPGGHAQRSWKGEFASRQELIKLLGPNKIGFLSDSLTDIYPTSTNTQQAFISDVYTVASLENDQLKRVSRVFRGGKGFEISKQDFTQIQVEDVAVFPSWQGLRTERFHRRN